MTISKETIELRKQHLAQDFSTLKGRIDTAEKEIVAMRNNLNAVVGAIQQCDMFLQELQPAETAVTGKTNSGSNKVEKEKGMPASKQQALNIATT